MPLPNPHLRPQAGGGRPPPAFTPASKASRTSLSARAASPRHAAQLRALCAEVWVATAAQPALPTARGESDSTHAKAGLASSPTSKPPLGFGGASLKGNTNQKQKEALLSCWQLCLSMSYEVLLYSWGRKKCLSPQSPLCFIWSSGAIGALAEISPCPAHPPETLSPYFITGSCARPGLSAVMEWIADFSAVLAKMRMETFCSRFLLFSETLAA